MPFPAHVIQLLVASPGDVGEERVALRQAMWEWNDEHAAALGVVLLPVGWETHSRPSWATIRRGRIGATVWARST